MITADTITDQQIRELLAWAEREKHRATRIVCKLALGESVVYRSASSIREARARCAEILNARREPGITPLGEVKLPPGFKPKPARKESK